MTFVWVSFWAVALLLWPGWVIWRLIGPRGLPPLLQLAPAFGLSMAVISTLGWLGFMLGIGFSGVKALVMVVLALSAFGTALTLRRHLEAETAPHEAMLPRWTLWGAVAIAIAATISALYSGPWMSFTADSFYHLAAIRSILAHGTALAQEVFFSTPVSAPDPTSGAWQLALALVAGFSGQDPIAAWRVATVLTAPLAVLAFFTLAWTITRNGIAAVIGTALYVFLSLSFDFRSAAYPNHFGLLLGWLALAFAIRYAGNASRRELAVGAPIAFAASAVHPALSPFLLTALACGLGAALIVRSPIWRRFAVAAAVVGAAALPLLVVNVLTLSAPAPYASMAQVAFPLRVVHRPWTWVWPGFWYYNVGTVFGTAFAIMLVRRWLAKELGAGLVLAALAAIPTAAVSPFFASSYVGQYTLARIADVIEPLAWLAWGWGLALVIGSARGRLRVPTIAIVIGCLLAMIPATVYGPLARVVPSSSLKSFATSRKTDLTAAWRDRLAALAPLPPSTVILAHPDTAYEIAGLTGREVVAVPITHTPAQVEVKDGPRRRTDTLDALYGRLDSANLAGVLEHYRVTHVLVDLEGENTTALRQLATAQILVQVASGDGWLLYRYDPTRLDAFLDLATQPLSGPDVAAFGAGPQQVLAGRAVFGRVEWNGGATGAARLEADLVGATGSFSRAVTAAGSPHSSETWALPVPPDAPVGQYNLRFVLPSGNSVAIGTFEVGRLYQAEDMGGVIAGDSRAWTVEGGGAYQGGLAASAVNVGSTAQQAIPPLPAGSYCVAARVYDDGSTNTDTIDVSLGDGHVQMAWSGPSAGLRWVRSVVTAGQPAGRVAITLVQRGQPGVLVDALEIYPLVEGECKSDAGVFTNT
jgi:hypothetical protein